MAGPPRFLLTPRWMALFALVLLVAAVCVRLGIWQLDRLEQRRALNDQVRSGLAAPPVTLPALTDGSSDPQALAYRRVEVTGTYDVERELLLYGRALEGRPGHHVLTPLLTGDGTAILVDRGWVPVEMDAPPVAAAAPPSGKVTVTGFLLPVDQDDAGVVDRDPQGRPLTVRHDVPAALEDALGYALWPLPLQLQEQSPPQPSPLPAVVGPPELDEGPHLSYAVQWFTFATIALAGFAVLVRREIRDRAREAATPASPAD